MRVDSMTHAAKTNVLTSFWGVLNSCIPDVQTPKFESCTQNYIGTEKKYWR